MRKWFKTLPMRTSSALSHVETWVSKDSRSDHARSYEVNVRLGKPIDILSLKTGLVENFAAQISRISSNRIALFESNQTERVDKCPICDSSTVDSEFRLSIYGALYHECSTCSHYFVLNRPREAFLKRFYSFDVDYSSTYTDKRVTEMRVQDVAIPKAKWMMEEFVRLYGMTPKLVLDVGAGGGHFVYACKKLGLKARGIEFSEMSRQFCRDNFRFDLETADFTKEWNVFSGVDIVTFWGVIEHVPNPMSFLKAAYQTLSGRRALVIAEVPRWDCLGTAIQSAFSDSVTRHLDPLGHINCFTDSSLATAFESSGFVPVSAWYFGMDAFELTMQLSYLMGEKGSLILDSLGSFIPLLQDSVDQVRLCDEMVLAGKPM